MATYRREACREAFSVVNDFLLTAPRHLLPNMRVLDYYQNAGDCGISFVLQQSISSLTPVVGWRVVGVALLCRPSSKKHTTYLSSVASAIHLIWQRRKLPIEAVLELALPIVYCPGIYVLCVVLLQIANDPTIQPTADGNGYFGLVFEMMQNICVTVTGGPHFRAQVSLNKSEIGRAVVDALQQC